MVGQFHPDCMEASVHNPVWREVSRSPVPLIAMRHMALHDILFLENDKDWFLHYNAKFGDRFNDPKTIEEYNRHLVPYYTNAKRRFS